MRKLSLIIAALSVLFSCACSKQGQETGVTGSVSLRESAVGAGAGSVFVSVNCSGAWKLTADFGSEAAWGRLDTSSGEGSRPDILFSYDAMPEEGTRSVRLVLSDVKGSSLSECTLYQQKSSGGTVTPQPGDEYGYGYDVAPYHWLELPATVKGDGLELLAHNMTGGAYQGRDRNWSCYWDYKEHLSLWVAYPLNNSLKGSGSRSNAWGFDPLLPMNLQPDLTARSYGGGWTRGHQLPSADRLATYAANASTFYPTNMTPQDYDFNAGIWAGLEGAVRSYAAKSDTLYVVTGCQYKASTQLSGSSSGFAVKIPTHYFKALLYKGSSTYAVSGGYMAAGFLLPHDSSISKGNYVGYICSIDELEQQTGIDFFPYLAEIIGQAEADKVEATAPSNWWK